MGLKGLQMKFYNNSNNNKATSVIGIIYKDYYSLNIFIENLVNLKSLLFDSSIKNYVFYLVGINNITTYYKTYNSIETKIKEMNKNNNNDNLDLIIHEINLTTDSDNSNNISQLLKDKAKKNTLFSFVVMIDDEVHYISNFFGLISFKQFSKRGNSFLANHFCKLQNGDENDF